MFRAVVSLLRDVRVSPTEALKKCNDSRRGDALFGRDSCFHPDLPTYNNSIRVQRELAHLSTPFVTPFPRTRRTHARLDRWHARAHRIPPHIPRHLGDVQFHTSHNPTSRWKLPASQCRVGDCMGRRWTVATSPQTRGPPIEARRDISFAD